MTSPLSIRFAKSVPGEKGALVLLVPEGGELPPAAGKVNESGRVGKAMKVADFTGKTGQTVDLIAPDGDWDRVVIVGIGDIADAGEDHWMKIGGKIFAACKGSEMVTVETEIAGKDEIPADGLAAIAGGAKLRAYSFDTYKTKKKDNGKKGVKMTFVAPASTALRNAWKDMDGVTDGVYFARDLVNEPANILGPVEFAKKASELEKLGCEVEILDEKKLKSLKMGALLGVAQGSVRPARVAVIQWNGGKAKDSPVAFVGKGVVFDTGGISIKPAAGMEDMKGDMGGAAAVCGVMHALAARKAKVNAVGVIGLVENMPDGNAQRPGDIVTSMSGQTIEVLNTDAEGRLVLADCLWYTEDRFKPKFMINLATLTGAIIVALGNHHAGLFSNDDDLSEGLTKAGLATWERVWCTPLDKEYDKMIDSKNADMKNIGGRWAGSITAGQFLQRFVRDVPWAHLDVAGTAMGSPKNEYSQSWASGFGVRLLNRLVADSYEK